MYLLVPHWCSSKQGILLQLELQEPFNSTCSEQRGCIRVKLDQVSSALFPSTETTQENIHKNKANTNRLPVYLLFHLLCSLNTEDLHPRGTEPWTWHFFGKLRKFRAMCIHFVPHYSVHVFYYLSQINFAGNFNNTGRPCQRRQLCPRCPDSQTEMHNICKS